MKLKIEQTGETGKKIHQSILYGGRLIATSRSSTHALMPAVFARVLIEDDNYAAVEVTTLLKERDQDQRAVLILHGKLTDKRDPAKRNPSKPKAPETQPGAEK